MGLFDTIMSAVEQHPDVNQEQHTNLIQTAMQTFSNRNAISGLMASADSQGLGHIVQSWVSNTPNQAIGPEQLQSIIGQDKINEIASRVGIPPAIASVALLKVLPVVVDRLTSEGRLRPS